jgi:hypothetical protein
MMRGEVRGHRATQNGRAGQRRCGRRCARACNVATLRELLIHVEDKGEHRNGDDAANPEHAASQLHAL